MQQTIEEITKQYPDEWLLLGDPVKDKSGQLILAATVMYHNPSKRELALMDKPLMQTCKRSALLFNRVTVRKKSVLIGGRTLCPIQPNANATLLKSTF